MAIKALVYKKYGEIIICFDAQEESGSAEETTIVNELSQQAEHP